MDGEIDLLIGSYNYRCLLTGEVKLCDTEGLVAVNSLFGLALSGSIGVKSEELHLTMFCSREILQVMKIVLVDFRKFERC